MNKVLLIDKYGTLISPASGAKFVNQPHDQAPLPGVKEALKHYASLNWTLIIISNQGGVEMGHKSLEDAIAEMQFCLKLFPEISEAYFCPNFKGGGKDCYCVRREDSWRFDADDYMIQSLEIQDQFRKPNSGMLRLALAIHLDPDIVLMVGDRPEDAQAAAAANVPFVSADRWRTHHAN